MVGGSSTATTYPIHTRSGSGALYSTASNQRVCQRSESNTGQTCGIGFNAANNWTGSTSSTGAHTHTINTALTKSSIYGNNETVQPPSVGLRVKTRYK